MNIEQRIAILEKKVGIEENASLYLKDFKELEKDTLFLNSDGNFTRSSSKTKLSKSKEQAYKNLKDYGGNGISKTDHGYVVFRYRYQ